MSFLWPWAFTLLAAPLLLRWLPLGRRSATAAAVWIPASLGEALNRTHDSASRSIRADHLLLWLAWSSLVVAIARPVMPGDSVVRPSSGRAMALAVDLSSSMEREDFVLDGVTRNRLELVKQVAGEFIAARHGDRLALVLFGREAFIASPLSFDLQALRDSLDSAGIGMAGRSTAIGDALGLAIQALRDDPAPEKAVVLLSDGTNNAGSVEPESAAELAARLGIRIHAIGLASEHKADGPYSTAPAADLDERTLAAIAEAAGGQFFRATTSEELVAIYRSVDRLERAESPAPPVIPRRELATWPTLAGLVLLLVWRLPTVRQRVS